MYSIAFPNIFADTKVNMLKDKEATASNLKLLLKSDRNTLLGDPDFGTTLKNCFFGQNNVVLQDVLIDEILTTIINFMPQLQVTRKDITIISKGVNLYAKINVVNKLDYTNNLYEINLTDEEEI